MKYIDLQILNNVLHDRSRLCVLTSWPVLPRHISFTPHILVLAVIKLIKH